MPRVADQTRAAGKNVHRAPWARPFHVFILGCLLAATMARAVRRWALNLVAFVLLMERQIRVGVAYGSPTDQVSERILECARRHGLVLKQPEPQVLFEEFGDSTLTFALYFWIDVRAGTSGPVVMSDLRFMIEKSFAEGGISMSFPQRDAYLDSLRPLQVELTRGAAMPA